MNESHASTNAEDRTLEHLGIEPEHTFPYEQMQQRFLAVLKRIVNLPPGSTYAEAPAILHDCLRIAREALDKEMSLMSVEEEETVQRSHTTVVREAMEKVLAPNADALLAAIKSEAEEDEAHKIMEEMRAERVITPDAEDRKAEAEEIAREKAMHAEELAASDSKDDKDEEVEDVSPDQMLKHWQEKAQTARQTIDDHKARFRMILRVMEFYRMHYEEQQQIIRYIIEGVYLE